jgi:hypothetical protein
MYIFLSSYDKIQSLLIIALCGINNSTDLTSSMNESLRLSGLFQIYSE